MGDTDLQVVETVLGENGLSRLREFQTYPAGWDFGDGEPLHPLCVVNLVALLTACPELAPAAPSLFMTRDGCLEVAFEDADGFGVEAQVGSYGFWIFGPDEIEDARPVDSAEELADLIRALLPSPTPSGTEVERG